MGRATLRRPRARAPAGTLGRRARSRQVRPRAWARGCMRDVAYDGVADPCAGNSCNGHGVCGADGTCTCSSGYSGGRCNIPPSLCECLAACAGPTRMRAHARARWCVHVNYLGCTRSCWRLRNAPRRVLGHPMGARCSGLCRELYAAVCARDARSDVQVGGARAHLPPPPH